MAIKKLSLVDALFNYVVSQNPPVFDRGRFYDSTLYMNQGDLERVKASLLDRIEVRMKAEGRLCSREHRYAVKEVESIFRPWTRLAGRIDSELRRRGIPGFPTRAADEEVFAAVCSFFSRQPEYKAYVDKELKGYVYNRCREWYYDYTMLPDELRTAELTEKFGQEYPFCMESKQWDLFGVAYELGEKKSMRLQEEAGFANGYIGGDVNWSRYLPIKNNVLDTKEGRITAIAQIDYKDCTNTFVVFDGNRKARFFDALDGYSQKRVLECVYLEDKFKKLMSAKLNQHKR